jgi:hypothetical protein
LVFFDQPVPLLSTFPARIPPKNFDTALPSYANSSHLVYTKKKA